MIKLLVEYKLWNAGTQDEIKQALAAISHKFPLTKYPEMTLVQVNAPAEANMFLPENVQVSCAHAQ